MIYGTLCMSPDPHPSHMYSHTFTHFYPFSPCAMVPWPPLIPCPPSVLCPLFPCLHSSSPSVSRPCRSLSSLSTFIPCVPDRPSYFQLVSTCYLSSQTKRLYIIPWFKTKHFKALSDLVLHCIKYPCFPFWKRISFFRKDGEMKVSKVHRTCHSINGGSHFCRETTNKNNQFSKWETWMFNAILNQFLFLIFKFGCNTM